MLLNSLSFSPHSAAPCTPSNQAATAATGEERTVARLDRDLVVVEVAPLGEPLHVNALHVDVAGERPACVGVRRPAVLGRLQPDRCVEVPAGTAGAMLSTYLPCVPACSSIHETERPLRAHARAVNRAFLVACALNGARTTRACTGGRARQERGMGTSAGTE